MLKLFYPYEYVDSVFSIDYQKLYSKGYRGIFFDIDNTLVHHGEDSTPEVDALFRQIHQIGFKTIILSNNSEKRILRFLKNIDSPYIAEAQKPKTDGYRKAVALLDIPKGQTLYIGDQLFTDIFGANRFGIASILVQYLRYPNEKKIGIRRNLEKVIIKCYQKSRTCCGRLGYICKEEAQTDAADQR